MSDAVIQMDTVKDALAMMKIWQTATAMCPSTHLIGAPCMKYFTSPKVAKLLALELLGII